MIIKVINPNRRDNTPPWKEYTFIRLEEPRHDFTPLSDDLTDRAFDCFAICNLHEVERVADDSLKRQTFKVLDGVRIACHWPEGTRRIEWCVLTAPVDKTGYVVVTEDDLMVQDLVPSILCYQSTRVFKSEEAAKVNIEEAKQNPKAKDPKAYDSLRVLSFPAAADELEHYWIDQRLVRDRIGLGPTMATRFPFVTK